MSNEIQASGLQETEETVQVTPPRNPILDVLRGAAVLAAFVVSVWAFGGFTTNMQTKLLLHPSGGNYRLFATVSLLLQGKMQALIALVFGASLVIFLHSRQQKDKGIAHDLYMRRQLWLIGFGLVNAFLFLWFNDLLFHLGVVGIIALPFIQAKPKGLLWAAFAAMLIFCGKQYWNYADDKKKLRKYEIAVALEKKYKQDSTDRARKDAATRALTKASKDTAGSKVKKDTLTKQQQSDKEAWEGTLKGLEYGAKKDEGDRKSMRSTSYAKLWDFVKGKAQAREAQYTYRIGVWEIGMMLLLGMALFKLGFFETSYSTRRYFVIAVIGIGLGLLLGWYRIYFHNATLLNYTKYIKAHWVPYNMWIPLERSIMAIGYAALLALLVRINILGWFWETLAKVGRMSLSNYLLQTLAGTLFFTGVGFNSYGNLSQWKLYLFVFEVSLIQIAFSMAWLHFYQIGPAEWLWRSLAEKQKLPLRKSRPLPAANNA